MVVVQGVSRGAVAQGRQGGRGSESLPDDRGLADPGFLLRQRAADAGALLAEPASATPTQSRNAALAASTTSGGNLSKSLPTTNAETLSASPSIVCSFTNKRGQMRAPRGAPLPHTPTWIPAFAGMTEGSGNDGFGTALPLIWDRTAPFQYQ